MVPLGVLLLHGFTSSLRTVDGLLPSLQRIGLPYRMPVLRGHGTRPEDLVGVTAQDWYDDASAALDELRGLADAVCVVGLSMGGVVALDLGLRRRDLVDSVVLVAPALRFNARTLAWLTPWLHHLRPWAASPNSFADPALRATSTNYRRFPVRTFARLYLYGREMESRLPGFDRPLLVLQDRHDTIVDPACAQLIYDRVASTAKEILWFERSGHEMMQDLEREAVFAAIARFLRVRLTQQPVR
jgi:carboxylesterase